MANDNQTGVAGLVAGRLGSPEVKAKETRKKFMLFLDTEDNAKLDLVAKATHTGKIEIASQMFKIGLTDAFKTLVAAGIVDEKTGTLKDAKTGSAPTPPAPKAQ